jgi:hypothetical protein
MVSLCFYNLPSLQIQYLSDYYVFPRMKALLKRFRCQSAEEVK